MLKKDIFTNTSIAQLLQLRKDQNDRYKKIDALQTLLEKMERLHTHESSRFGSSPLNTEGMDRVFEPE